MSTLKAQPGFLDNLLNSRDPAKSIYIQVQKTFSTLGPHQAGCSVAFQSGKPYLLIDVFPFATARQNGINSIMDFYDKNTGNLLFKTTEIYGS